MTKKIETSPPTAPTATGGRSLIWYALPLVVVATLALVLVALVAMRLIADEQAGSADRAASGVAGAVAARIGAELDARRRLLELALADGSARAALERRDEAEVAEVMRGLEGRVAGLVRARLVTPDTTQRDLDGPAPLGYAGLDLARRTLDAGRVLAAEVHQINSGDPYLALALPVQGPDGDRAGVLFSAWDIGFVARIVRSSTGFGGRLALVQGGPDGHVVAQGPGEGAVSPPGGSVDVPNSIWRIEYGVAPAGRGSAWRLFALVGGGVALVLLTALLQARALGRDLRTDMGTLVGLAEAIMERQGSPQAAPRLAGAGAAIALLADYARSARGQRPAQPPPPPRPATPVARPIGGRADGVEVEELDSDPSESFAAAAATGGFDVPANVFRAYDIRGRVGEGVDEDLAELLGRAVGSLVQEEGGSRVAVARDARLSSPGLCEALIRGLSGAGVDVADIGQAPTPLLNFALARQPLQAGVMVTGSHNPPDCNGFKIFVGDRVLDGEALLGLRQRIVDGRFSQGNGKLQRIDMSGDYVEAVLQELQLARPLKVVVDAGNGVAGGLAVRTLEALGCDVVPLYCEPDGSFPNHHPDPSQPDNLAPLVREVRAQQADVGIAFDGDGDRLGVVDDTGAIVWPDRLLMMLAADILGRHPGVDILYDVKSSRHVAGFVLSHGGRPIMWQSGHSRMRAKMIETGALLGGEFTGHLFVKERWFGFDDAVYGAVRVLELLALDQRSSSEVFAELPSSPATPEYHLPLDEGRASAVMQALDARESFGDARLLELDGLRVEFADGWGLVRPSNTSSALTFRFEADDEVALDRIKARFRDLLRRAAPDLRPPF